MYREPSILRFDGFLNPDYNRSYDPNKRVDKVHLCLSELNDIFYFKELGTCILRTWAK